MKTIAGNMKNYIMDVHGFEGEMSTSCSDSDRIFNWSLNLHWFIEDNIVVLLDDGNHTEPTYENIIDAYKTVVSQSEDGDCIFLHYSGEI